MELVDKEERPFQEACGLLQSAPDSSLGVIPIKHYVISTKTYVLAWILLWIPLKKKPTNCLQSSIDLCGVLQKK